MTFLVVKFLWPEGEVTSYCTFRADRSDVRARQFMSWLIARSASLTTSVTVKYSKWITEYDSFRDTT